MEVRICIDVDDMARAVAFYTEGLGLQVGRRFKSDFVEILGAGSPIDLLFNAPGTRPVTSGAGSEAVRHYGRHWTPVHLDFVVEDIEAAVARLQQYGAVLEMPVAERVWGRIAGLADPFGHGLDLLEFKGRGYDEILQPH
ncbi:MULTISPECIES: VOC family protein [unclassified Polaromonas]|uniref:VOC family protein n=1 Tax=unclassified Polaromonas TaxID=2638319 RepID=UPI000F0759BB|nr:MULTISPECIES: VOC family protein [unclassified Polaromonas]AYQ29180.1 VOC family protein [Polaromonas sp. SP1]QGJ19706.1 VOC family protein [Polaromonas sp. Pch-P]